MIVDRDLGIRLRDGTRLSAKIWRPKSSEAHPVPAILEYLPYRKTDGTAQRDDTMHPWFAEKGYACLRVDRRGCGDSEGLFDDEYSEQELSDGVEILHWIAAQPWCTGNIGMQGISWGGFNGVQIAARAPEPLKAVISIGTTVDRYHDDIHYKGGIQLAENIGWAATATSWFSMPPDPELVGDDWREIWLTRLKKMPFMAKRWTENSDRSSYWKHGSICEDFDALKAPVFAMGGLHDGYRNAMAAMVENLSCPAQGLTGPWSHKYPHISTIEPSIDYHNVALRWWDRWLKGIDNGAEKDPAMRVYVLDSIPPDDHLTHRPGQWVAEAAWPPKDTINLRLLLSDGVLGSSGPLSAIIEPDLLCGEAAGEFFPFGFGSGELPGDQQIDDARSCCFDTAPLDADKIILGAPTLRLTVIPQSPRAQIVARLCDVHPDGRSTLITIGLLNLRHRDGFEEKKPLRPGQAYDISLDLDQSAYNLPAGHRLRLSLSSSYWPYCWPEAETALMRITDGELSVPFRNVDTLKQCEFPPPITARTRAMKQLREATSEKTWRTDATGQRVLEITADHGQQLDLETRLVTESLLSETWRIDPSSAGDAEAVIVWTRALSRDDWKVTTRVACKMKGTAKHFEIDQNMTAWENDQQVFARTDTAQVSR